MTFSMEQQKLIIDNRSTTPLYVMWGELFDIYTEADTVGFPEYTMYLPSEDREFRVKVIENRASLTLRIEDID